MAEKTARKEVAVEALSEGDLSRWKLVEDFRRRLVEASARVVMPRSEEDPRRKLLSADYFSLLLFGLFNPVVRTMRGLCEASKLGRVQREISNAYVSLGSFSEAQAVFAPEVLEEVLKELGARSGAAGPDFKRDQAGTVAELDHRQHSLSRFAADGVGVVASPEREAVRGAPAREVRSNS